MTESQILEQVRQFTHRTIGLPHNSRLIVGFSGGADSVALLDMLVRMGYEIVAAHCNFGLRGEESERDHRFAQELSQRLGVPFHSIRFDTSGYVEKHKVSVEMACRELRYDWFAQLQTDCGASYTAIAHHIDDSDETLLLNLIRGTGISGLTGIRPVNGKIVRPLLCIGRQDIESYLTQRDLPYITDSSNRADIYTRNKLRLQLMPWLKTINPAISEALQRTARNLRDTEAVYLAAIATQMQQVATESDDATRISITRLLSQPSPRALLFELLKPFRFVPSVIDEILESLSSISGKNFFSPTHRVIKDRDQLIVSPIGNPQHTVTRIDHTVTQLEHPVRLTFSYHDPEHYNIPRKKTIACFDADKLRFPLTLRKWQTGDRFTPFGMRGSQKISDYFSDHKYSLLRKEQAWLLCSDNDIIWLVGERSSDKYRIDSQTTSILQIQCEI